MKVTIVLMIVFMLGLASAVGEWGDINTGDDSDGNITPVDSGIGVEDLAKLVMQDSGSDVVKESKGANKYTRDFYLALGLGILGFLIVAYFIYLFLKVPKNKWKKKKVNKKNFVK